MLNALSTYWGLQVRREGWLIRRSELAREIRVPYLLSLETQRRLIHSKLVGIRFHLRQRLECYEIYLYAFKLLAYKEVRLVFKVNYSHANCSKVSYDVITNFDLLGEIFVIHSCKTFVSCNLSLAKNSVFLSSF